MAHGELDIVDRLRWSDRPNAKDSGLKLVAPSLLEEAADEIERLNKLLEDITTSIEAAEIPWMKEANDEIERLTRLIQEVRDMAKMGEYGALYDEWIRSVPVYRATTTDEGQHTVLASNGLGGHSGAGSYIGTYSSEHEAAKVARAFQLAHALLTQSTP